MVCLRAVSVLAFAGVTLLFWAYCRALKWSLGQRYSDVVYACAFASTRSFTLLSIRAFFTACIF